MFPFYLIPAWLGTFLLIGILKVVFSLLGIIMIPLAVLFGAYQDKPSPMFENQIIKQWTWKIMEPWQNYEDGIVAGSEYKDKPEWFRIIYWSAIRNPANAIRFWSLTAPKVKQAQVKFIASWGSTKDNLPLATLLDKEEHGVFWYLAWQGAYANFRIQFNINNGNQIRFWIGTKIYPSSQHKIPYYQRHGIGTTLQIKRLQPKDQ